jgi:hypothetical protein
MDHRNCILWLLGYKQDQLGFAVSSDLAVLGQYEKADNIVAPGAAHTKTRDSIIETLTLAQYALRW